MEQTKPLYGLENEIEEFQDPSTGFIIWKLKIHHPFYHAGKLMVGIRERIIRKAMAHGVSKLMLGDDFLPMPDEKELLRKEKVGEYELRESKFVGREGFKVFFFEI